MKEKLTREQEVFHLEQLDSAGALNDTGKKLLWILQASLMRRRADANKQ
jgi:hypothetical protein